MTPIQSALALIPVLSIAFTLCAQPTSSIQFYDSTGTNTTARFGWAGSSATGYFEIETPNDGNPVKVQSGNVTVDGSVTAASFIGDGSGLTNISGSNTIPDGSITSAKLADGSVLATKLAAGVVPDSISWTNIKGMPAGFVDGLDNEGTPVSTIADGSITTAKLADTAVTDAKIKSVSYSKVTGAPTTMTPTDASVTAAKIATGAVTDVKLAANAVTTAKIADEAVTDAKIDSVSWGKVSNKPAIPDGNSLDASDGSPVDAVIVDGNGNVGIGIPNPATKLEVNGKLSLTWNDVSQISFDQATANPMIFSSGQNGNSDADPFSARGSLIIQSRPFAAAKIVFGTGATITERMRIASDGKVGIGTPSPTALLSTVATDGIADNNWVGLFENQEATADRNFGLLVKAGSSAVDENLRLTTKNGALLMSVMGSGKVGIGKTPTTDASLLQVCGSISATSATVTALSCSSDRRYKKSITPLKSCLEKISSLQSVSYSWDTEKYPDKQFPSARQIGLIAQDVEKVVPEVVYTGADGYKSLSYDKLTVLLIEAAKEQQAIIDNLADENANLKSRLQAQEISTAKLSERLARLEGLSSAD